MLSFDKTTFLSLLFKLILSVRIKCFTILRIHKYGILFYNFIEFLMSLYTFLVISFARYRECRICLISFSKFSDVLPAFTCAKAIDDL